MTFDDFALHEMNAITANACDLVLSHCPFSVKKYDEKQVGLFLEEYPEISVRPISIKRCLINLINNAK